jgi:antitoxin VapB
MPSKTASKTRTRKLFRNGGSQAVRIPKEMRFATDEVLLRREGDRLILEPKARTLAALSREMGEPLDWDWDAPDPTVRPEDVF